MRRVVRERSKLTVRLKRKQSLEQMLLLFFALGGFGASLGIALTYFESSEFERPIKNVLGGACLIPLVSLALLQGGLFASGNQWLATSPCIVSGLLFLVALGSGKPVSFLRSPARAVGGLLSIGWSGVTAFYSSDYCFMGACC